MSALLVRIVNAARVLVASIAPSNARVVSVGSAVILSRRWRRRKRSLHRHGVQDRGGRPTGVEVIEQ
jgi:hypothetical protein